MLVQSEPVTLKNIQYRRDNTMSQKQLDLFTDEYDISQIVIDLHNIAHRVENNGNPDGIGYSIREIADRLSECKKPGWHMEWVPDSESWYEP